MYDSQPGMGIKI